MKPAYIKWAFVLFLLNAGSLCAQAYRLLLFDSKNNTYEECSSSQQYAIVTRDSMLRSGFISNVGKDHFLFSSNLRTDTIYIGQVINVGYGFVKGDGGLASKICGYVLTSMGGLVGLAGFSALTEGERGVAAVLGVVAVPMLASGIVLIHSGYRNGAGNRANLVNNRYRLRIVRSAL